MIGTPLKPPSLLALADVCLPSPPAATGKPQRNRNAAPVCALFLFLVTASTTESLIIGTTRLAVAQAQTASSQGTQSTTETTGLLDGSELIEALATRCAYWIAPASPRLKQLEYTYLRGQTERQVKLVKGTAKARYSLWQGCSLRTGIHAVLGQPERFAIDVSPGDDAKTIRLRAQVKPDEQLVRIEVGNGIEGSWSGYYSHPTREVMLVVDKNRLLPVEEKSGQTTVRFRDWKPAGSDRWVPGIIDIRKGKTHYRMHFDWMDDAVWLLTRGASVSRDGIYIRARTRNVTVNGNPVVRQLTGEEQRWREAGEIVRRMLQRNRAWLDPELTAFDSLAYTFHTVREDVREEGYLNRDGVAIFEVIHDGQNKMGDLLGDRRIGLPTGEVAYADRAGRFAKISPRSDSRKSQPADQRYRHYARIGCQLDLPIFRYRARLDTAQIKVDDGVWDGRPCHVVRISNLGPDVYLGAGTMFGFTSWSYVHHVRPSSELIYMDKETLHPLHETLVDARSGRTFEIEFSDYVPVTPGSDAPLSISLTAQDYFACHYRFQLVNDRHWMLEEVVSWFDADNKSRGRVENVRENQPSELYAAAISQVEATRRLFGEPATREKVSLDAVPVSVGKYTDIGRFRVLLTVDGSWDVVVQVSTNDKSAPVVVPVLLLDEHGHPLFATHVKLAPSDDGQRGSANLGSSRLIGNVQWCVVPGAAESGGCDQAVPAYDCRWEQPLEINVRDCVQGKTGAFQVVLTRDADKLARASVSIASQAGPAEFIMDVSVALLTEDGELVAAGQHHGTLRVERGVVEATYDVDLGPLSDPSRATHVVVAVTPGDVVSAPMGTIWGRFVRERHAIPVEVLLASDAEACWGLGLRQLGRQIQLADEFFDEFNDRRRIKERGQDRETVLAPYVQQLVRIVGGAADSEVLRDAVRLLGHAGARRHVSVVRPMLDHEDGSVADAAAAALAMLGSSDGLYRLRAVLQRERPNGDFREARRTADRLEVDTLIALSTLSDQRSIDLLGEILRNDLATLSIAEGERGRAQLTGRPGRIKRAIAVLGYAGNEQAVPLLKSAAEFLADHPEVSAHFDQIPLAQALLQYESRTRDFIAAQIAAGHFAYIRSFKLDGHKNEYYVPAVHKMLLNPAVSAWTVHQGVTYLWNVGTPAASEVLRDAHTRGIQKGDARTWMLICEALASLGDDRGVRDAYEAHVELFETREPPADEDARKAWEHRREWLAEGAEEILSHAGRRSILEVVQSRLTSDRPAERRAMMELLWQLPATPESVQVTLRQWRSECDEQDSEFAQQLVRLLNRDAE